MSMGRVQLIKCEKCGKEFEITIWDSVNSKINPELRKKIIKRDFYEHTCPYCGEHNYMAYPTLYHDMDKKFMISCGPLSFVMDMYKNQSSASNRIEEKFPEIDNLFKEYVYCGVTQPNELFERVIVLENNIDYRIANIYKIYVCDYYYKKLGKKLVSSFYTYDEKGNIILVAFGEKDEFFEVFDFSYELYDKLHKLYIDKVNEVFSYVFDEKIALKLITTKKDEITNLMSFKTKVVVVELEKVNSFFAKILPEQIRTYNEGDSVLVASPHGYTYKGVVLHSLETNNYATPINAEQCYVVISKFEDIELTTTKTIDEELNNEALLNMLLQWKNDKKDFPVDLVWESDAILGVKGSLRLNKMLNKKNMKLEDLLKKGANIPIDEIFLEMETKEIKGAKFMCVYLTKDKMGEGTSGYVYRLNDIIELALFKTDCNGIIINQNSDEIFLLTPLLYKAYIHDRFMLNADRMAEVLKAFDNEDINYVIKQNYEVICKVYLEGKTPDQIAKEMNLSQKEVGDCLGYGYRYIKELLNSKYILRRSLFK